MKDVVQMFDFYLDRQRRKLFGTRTARITLISRLVYGGFIAFVVGIIFVIGLFAWYSRDLPRPDKVQRTTGLSTVVLDRNGVKLYDIFQEADRIPAAWDEVPQYLRDATVAVEDKDFYKHQGLSTTGIIRALLSNVFSGGVLQGGSTLTQQLVKTVLLSQERTLPRKIKEAILAIQIERKYSKNDILLMYLNEAPYGGTAAGVKAAAEDYFGKPVKDLTLVQCAVLAGLPQSPSYYSPFTGDAKAYIARAQHVLRRMREDGYITASQEVQADNALPSLTFSSPGSDLRAPHFVQYVKELLIQQLGEKIVNAGGLTVTTTLDWNLQEAAQTVVREEVDKAKKLKVSNGAALVLNPNTGEILAMVGSKDYSSTDSSGLKYNVAIQAERQPGSSLKPIIYAAALSKGYTASALLMDVDTKYPSGDPTKPEYEPKNYDGKFRGPIQMRYALGNSINTVAVKMTALVGVKDILKLGYDMGVSTWQPTDEMLKRVGLSLPLGGAEVHMIDEAVAYGTLATGGNRMDPVAILKVTDTKGKILYEYKQTPPRQVLDPSIPYIISSILSDNDARKDEFGPNSYLVIPGRTVAAKTGTTDDKRDNWTAGYTKDRVVVTWVGNNDNSPMNPALASGITGAAPIWNRIMKAAIKDLPDAPFTQPDTVIQMDIDGYGGGLPVDGQPKRKEYFVKGTEPTGPAVIYQKLKISHHDSSKLANPVEVATGDYDQKDFIVFKEDDPVSGDGKNRWQDAINAWINGLGDNGKYKPPTDTYNGTNQIVINIKSPSDQSQVSDNNVTVTGEVISTADIDKVQVTMNGTTKESSDKNFSQSFNVSNGQYTIHVHAVDKRGTSSDRDVHIGVNQAYATPTSAPAPTP